MLLVLIVGATWALQAVPPVVHRAATAANSRAGTPEAFDLYPAPGAPPAPGADGWFKDFGKQKLSPEMLKAAGMADGKSSRNKRQPVAKKKSDAPAEAPGSLGTVLGGFAVVLAVVLATQAGGG